MAKKNQKSKAKSSKSKSKTSSTSDNKNVSSGSSSSSSSSSSLSSPSSSIFLITVVIALVAAGVAAFMLANDSSASSWSSGLNAGALEQGLDVKKPSDTPFSESQRIIEQAKEKWELRHAFDDCPVHHGQLSKYQLRVKTALVQWAHIAKTYLDQNGSNDDLNTALEIAYQISEFSPADPQAAAYIIRQKLQRRMQVSDDDKQILAVAFENNPRDIKLCRASAQVAYREKDYDGWLKWTKIASKAALMTESKADREAAVSRMFQGMESQPKLCAMFENKFKNSPSLANPPMYDEDGQVINNFQPIFINAVPRSGTTLLESKLSRHSQIGTIGEAVSVSQAYGDGSSPLPKVKEKWYKSVQGANRDSRSERDLSFILEKTVFEGTFLSQLLFPDGRVIRVFRSPLDNMLSWYENDLPVHWSSTWEDIVNLWEAERESYEVCRDLISKRQPDWMMEIHYADLVGDLDKSLHKIIDFIGLDWEDTLLSDDPVPWGNTAFSTISSVQIKQKVTTKRTNRWISMAKQLARLHLGQSVSNANKLTN